MPTTIWTGAISFGLVHVPVKLVSATSRKDVSFRQLRAGDHSRIRYRKVAQADGEEVDTSDIVKGYEISPDHYVVVTSEEMDSVDPEASRTIDIEDFVELGAIDPVYFESSYYLVPANEGAGKPYRLLVEAMTQSGMAAVARFVLRTKQHHAVIRPRGDALAISTLRYADEVVDPTALDAVPDDVTASEREVASAASLIDSMTVEWEPERYHDTHREKLLELIEAKAEGQEIVTTADVEEEGGDVVDLMAALEASIEAQKQARDGEDDADTA